MADPQGALLTRENPSSESLFGEKFTNFLVGGFSSVFFPRLFCLNILLTDTNSLARTCVLCYPAPRGIRKAHAPDGESKKAPVWPDSVCLHSPVQQSQIFAVWSPSAERASDPSAEKTAELTSSVCPDSVCLHSPVQPSQVFAVSPATYRSSVSVMRPLVEIFRLV